MKITEFNKANLQYLRTEIDKALATVGKDNGIELSIKNISFSHAEFTTQLQATIGDGSEAARLNWDLRTQFIDGLEAEHFGAQFLSNRDKCEITGFNARSTKYPVEYRNLANGKSYKTTVDAIKRKLA